MFQPNWIQHEETYRTMPNSKRKGSTYERSLVNQATASGLPAERAYASNGKSLGHSEAVDLVVLDQRIQAKIRAGFPLFLRELLKYADSDGVDAVAFRQDGGESYVLISWFDYLDLLKRVANAEESVE